MAVEETKEQQQIYNIFRACIYVFLIMEIVINLPITASDPIGGFLLNFFRQLGFFNSVIGCKFIELTCVFITCIGSRPKKDLKFNMKKMVVYPMCIGFYLLVFSILVHHGEWGSILLGFHLNRIIYALCSVLAIMFIHQAGDAISKHMRSKIGDDRFNFENESFQQTTDEINNDYSVNIPMIFYYKHKMNHGYINITNPFRGTLVLGTPGSGKSFGIIDPFIRQHSAKGFTMMVYDYKFPTLAKELLYNYYKNKKYGHLPENCAFRIINFADVRHSNRINPIQKKYIPDLAAASETAATLLESLNKGGGQQKGGSEAFFKNASENFLAAIIYFFVNFHPVGFRHGKKLNRYFHYTRIINANQIEEGDLKLEYRNWTDYVGVNEKGEVVIDFNNKNFINQSVDENKMFIDLEGLAYRDVSNCLVTITKTWYEDSKGNIVQPDTVTGEYSDMAHVLQFLNKSYDDVFKILMSDPHIKPLMAPFQSAYKNRAMDQLEGMVGTLRVAAGRLASQEAYWIFTGDDFDLKISDKEHPCYLVIANDPEKEQIIGSLNALILNRLVTRVNSKGNYPCSIIVDELPTLYFHKLDRLIGTARSNKVSVTLGFQETPQLESDYGKNGMEKILSTCGNIFMGAARSKETLNWAQELFGKVKQTSKSVTISDKEVSTNISEKMDNLIPASKIADMATGWLAGQAARDFTPTKDSAMTGFDIENSEEFKTTKYFCKTNFDMERIKEEESKYMDIPPVYDFGSDKDLEITLSKCFNDIDKDIENLIAQLNPKGEKV
jgi:hypothetical protein